MNCIDSFIKNNAQTPICEERERESYWSEAVSHCVPSGTAQSIECGICVICNYYFDFDALMNMEMSL